LRTDPSTDTRQAILIFEYPYCFRHITITDSPDKGRDIYLYRAAINAVGLGALDAAACFGFSLLSTIAQRNLVEISSP